MTQMYVVALLCVFGVHGICFWFGFACFKYWCHMFYIFRVALDLWVYRGIGIRFWHALMFVVLRACCFHCLACVAVYFVGNLSWLAFNESLGSDTCYAVCSLFVYIWGHSRTRFCCLLCFVLLKSVQWLRPSVPLLKLTVYVLYIYIVLACTLSLGTHRAPLLQEQLGQGPLHGGCRVNRLGAWSLPEADLVTSFPSNHDKLCWR